MKALIGHTLTQAKEIAKRELGVKRMGESRFQLILDEGVKRGDFIIEGDSIVAYEVEETEEEEDIFAGDDFFAGVEELPPIGAKTTHPEVAHLDPKLSSSDLPRPGDLYHYRAYSGEVVQGEVKSMVCFAECQNPDGTWQSVAFQDLYIKKRGVPKETLFNELKAFYRDNSQLQVENSKLRSEYEALRLKIQEVKDEVSSTPLKTPSKTL